MHILYIFILLFVFNGQAASGGSEQYRALTPKGKDFSQGYKFKCPFCLKEKVVNCFVKTSGLSRHLTSSHGKDYTFNSKDYELSIDDKKNLADNGSLLYVPVAPKPEKNLRLQALLMAINTEIEKNEDRKRKAIGTGDDGGHETHRLKK